MRRHIVSVLLWALAVTAAAQTKNELDYRVRKLMTEFDLLQSNPEARIPADKLKRATGVIIMERTKGGFIFGYERGFGVALVKTNSAWSPFSFMNSNEGSFGAQIGGKSTFCVILLMNEAARDQLANPKVSFGGEAGGTGGTTSGGVGDNFTQDPPVLVFGESKGLYGGATIKGGSVAADDQKNHEYYGQFYSVKDILFENKVKPSETAIAFAKKLEVAAKDK